MKRFDLYYCDGEGDLCGAEMRQDPEGEWVKVSDVSDPPWLKGLLDALGWQGGTIHDALREVKALAIHATQ